VISIHEAIDTVIGAVRPLPAEEVPLLEALGRATATEIVSPEAVPSFDNSAMDGYAVRGAELAAGRREFRVVVDIPAGRWVGEEVGAGEAAKIMTGAPLPPGVDTVVQVEYTEQHGETLVVAEPVQPGANVRHAAEDVAVGDVLFPRGARLGPAEIGLLASVSCDRVAVARRPRVAILATGSELRLPGQPLGPGQIRNSNSFTAYGQVLAAGGEPVLLGIARDDLDETRRLLADALEQDVVITSGGVSVGEYDFVKQVQDELGVERRFWGVATKPGKPLAFGTRGDTLVFGVPGNPVAAMVSFEMYVRPGPVGPAGPRGPLPTLRLRRRGGARQALSRPHRGTPLPAAAPRAWMGLHHHRPPGLGHLALHGPGERAGLRAAGVPRRGARRRTDGHDARRQRRGAPAVPRGPGGGGGPPPRPPEPSAGDIGRRRERPYCGAVTAFFRSVARSSTAQTIRRWLAL
jgi:molybdopterin molybdotransferase